MLSQDEKRKQAVIVSDSGDLFSAGKKSAMQRLIAAIKADEPAQAADALEAFMELCDND